MWVIRVIFSLPSVVTNHWPSSARQPENPRRWNVKTSWLPKWNEFSELKMKLNDWISWSVCKMSQYGKFQTPNKKFRCTKFKLEKNSPEFHPINRSNFTSSWLNVFFFVARLVSKRKAIRQLWIIIFDVKLKWEFDGMRLSKCGFKTNFT